MHRPAEAAVASIVLDRLAKTYDNGFRAVCGIDLAIRDREFMVLVGPSGCGKTTTLRMIAGLEEVSGGSIAIGDRVVNEIEPKDRDLAMVFQNYALYPHMTVAENLSYALRLRKEPKASIAAKVAEAARLLALEPMLDRYPRQLSGGQRQRVAVGRAIVRKPQAFLFDEPLSNLDAQLRGEMRCELKTLQQRLDATCVYVTHDQIEAMTLGDRITVMNRGVIQQVAAPTTLYAHPWNRFVAGFIGTPPMNLLAGALERDGEGWLFRSGPLAAALRMPHTQALAGVSGSVTLGIRPEDLADARHEPVRHGDAVWELTVRVVELLGDHQYVHLVAPGGAALIMKNSTRHPARSGETIPVRLDTRHAHLFAGTDDAAENRTLPPDFARQQ
jgi:multiple sugar transport system ATP-binding protein